MMLLHVERSMTTRHLTVIHRRNWWSVRFTWIDWDNLIELHHQVCNILSCLCVWTNDWTFKLVIYAVASKWVSKTDFKKQILFGWKFFQYFRRRMKNETLSIYWLKRYFLLIGMNLGILSKFLWYKFNKINANI